MLGYRQISHAIMTPEIWLLNLRCGQPPAAAGERLAGAIAGLQKIRLGRPGDEFSGGDLSFGV